MLGNGEARRARIQAIRALLETEAIHGQEELVERLRVRGIEVAQASISRDLREIGASKVGGTYRLSQAAPVPAPSPLDLVRQLILAMSPAGPHLLVVKTVVGGASPVGIAVDAAGWPEVVGTVAGDDTLLVATGGRRQQERVRKRLESLGAKVKEGRR